GVQGPKPSIRVPRPDTLRPIWPGIRRVPRGKRQGVARPRAKGREGRDHPRGWTLWGGGGTGVGAIRQGARPADRAAGRLLGERTKMMVERYKATTNATDVPPHCSMGYNQTWILLNNVLPIAKEKYGGFDAEAVRKAALDVDIPPGGTIQGYGVKFYPPGTQLSGQNERSTPVVMQNAGEHISVVWRANIKTQEPVLPLPASSIYATR